jgi:hypothetical protein
MGADQDDAAVPVPGICQIGVLQQRLVGYAAEYLGQGRRTAEEVVFPGGKRLAERCDKDGNVLIIRAVDRNLAKPGYCFQYLREGVRISAAQIPGVT